MRKPKESKLDQLKADLIRAKEKASEWQARVRDIERQITEQENLEIIQAVRGMISAPEDLRAVLDMIRAVNAPSTTNSGIIPHLHSVHNGSRIRHLHERGDADGTAQENRIEAENSVG